MTFTQLSTKVIEVKHTAMMIDELAAESTTYETRILSNGAVEATDTITKP